MTELTPKNPWVILGRLSGIYGVKGWLKVHSETEPKANILTYSPWFLDRGQGFKEHQIDQGKPHGKGLLVKLADCDDRDQAEAFVGAKIAIKRSQLNDTLEQGEFYWADLVGLDVRLLDGTLLGQVDHLFETGSNDVMVVKGEKERLVPFIWEQVVVAVDLSTGFMTVDWDPEF